jgi:peroxiredoxin family protein
VSAPSQRLELAVVLSAGELERLYSGLSILVSSAVEGRRSAALATFRALELLLADDLERRARAPEATPTLSREGRETFAASLSELRELALGLDGLELWACSASVETMGVDERVEELLAGVVSTPRFLREASGARLLFV